MRLHNRFDIEIIDAKTGEVKQKAFAENVILNNWWSVLENNGVPFSKLAFGSGSGTPSVNDTTLFNYEATLSLSTPSPYQYVDYDNGVAWYKKYIRLTEQQYVGKTFSEVGLISENEYLTTHAMLQDMNGNPVTIEKTDADIFNIYATVYCHWTGATKHRFFWNTSMNQFIGWALGVRQIPYRFRILYAKSANNANAMAEIGTSSYPVEMAYTIDSTNKLITYDGSTIRLAVGNGNGNGTRGGGIGFAKIVDSGAPASGLVLPAEDFYDGDNITGEAVGTGDGSATRFYTKIDMPENAKVYVNGVQRSSGVTVRKCGGYQETPGHYISLIRHESTPSNIMYYTSGWQNYGTGYITMHPESNADDFNGVVFKNENYVVGIEKFTLYSIYDGVSFSHTKLYGSNDFSNWTQIYETSDFTPGGQNWASFNVVLNSNDRHYKYFKIVRDSGNWGSTGYSYFSLYVTDDDCKQIIFDTAPAVGDVITIDYHTPWIAKDADHVLDAGRFTMAYGPYSE